MIINFLPVNLTIYYWILECCISFSGFVKTTSKLTTNGINIKKCIVISQFVSLKASTSSGVKL